MHLGVISHLPQGSEITMCGNGFNDRTIKVEWQECYFYVFLEDLERVREPNSFRGPAKPRGAKV